LAHYMQCLNELRRQLSPSKKRVDISEELKARLDHYSRVLECQITDRPDEPYRRLASYIIYRLRLAMSEPDHAQAYQAAEDFAEDLTIIRDSLALHKGSRLARLLVDPLFRKLDTFGFHFYTLDVRQHTLVHAKAVTALSAAERDAAPAREV